jgi:voltage-gated potassium channel
VAGGSARLLTTTRGVHVEPFRVDERAERIKARFEWPMIAAALLVIPTIALEQSNVGEPWDTTATVLNWTIWTAFAAELVAMLAVVPDRRRYLRTHPLDVAIVVLTPPFLPASLQAARVFRLLRLLRLVRTALVLRRLLSAEGLRDAAVLALVIVLGGGAAFAAVESDQNLSAWDGVWWAITTVTTVGYGDISPQTDAGRVIAMTVMLVGIGFVALLTAAAADRFIKHGGDGPGVEEQLAEMNARLERLERALHRH